MTNEELLVLIESVKPLCNLVLLRTPDGLIRIDDHNLEGLRYAASLIPRKKQDRFIVLNHAQLGLNYAYWSLEDAKEATLFLTRCNMITSFPFPRSCCGALDHSYHYETCKVYNNPMNKPPVFICAHCGKAHATLPIKQGREVSKEESDKLKAAWEKAAAKLHTKDMEAWDKMSPNERPDSYKAIVENELKASAAYFNTKIWYEWTVPDTITTIIGRGKVKSMVCKDTCDKKEKHSIKKDIRAKFNEMEPKYRGKAATDEGTWVLSTLRRIGAEGIDVPLIARPESIKGTKGKVNHLRFESNTIYAGLVTDKGERVAFEILKGATLENFKDAQIAWQDIEVRLTDSGHWVRK